MHSLGPTFEALQTHLGVTTVTMAKLLLGVLLVTHWAACLFYMLGRCAPTHGHVREPRHSKLHARAYSLSSL